jgi:hypothetical protein
MTLGGMHIEYRDSGGPTAERSRQPCDERALKHAMRLTAVPMVKRIKKERLRCRNGISWLWARWA